MTVFDLSLWGIKQAGFFVFRFGEVSISARTKEREKRR